MKLPHDLICVSNEKVPQHGRLSVNYYISTNDHCLKFYLMISRLDQSTPSNGNFYSRNSVFKELNDNVS